MRYLGIKGNHTVAIVLAILFPAVGVTLGSCGTSSRESSTAGLGSGKRVTSTARASKQSETASKESVPKVTINVSIPVLLGHAGVIPLRYTCDGANMSLPVRWSHIPKGTADLALFLVMLNARGKGNFFDWAVNGLNPKSFGISAGQLPAGTVVGRNSFGRNGYSVCPPKGAGEEVFVLRVLALPRSPVLKLGFDVEAFYNEAEGAAKVAGVTGAVYTRQ